MKCVKCVLESIKVNWACMLLLALVLAFVLFLCLRGNGDALPPANGFWDWF